MSAGAPALPLGVDPLIAEAKERARRRRWLALSGLAVIAAAAIGTTFAVRASGNALGVCAAPPAGWKQRTVAATTLSPLTVVLTNFRFGRMDNFYGLAGVRFPSQGVTVAVSNEAGPHGTPPIRQALRVSRRDFWGLEGLKSPAANVAIRAQGRILVAYVEVGKLGPATIAAANRALAGVRTCSA